MAPSEIVVRPAHPTDAVALSALTTTVFRQTYGAAIPEALLVAYLARTFSYIAVDQRLRDPACAWWVVTGTDGLVGCCQLVTAPPPAPLAPARTLGISNFYIAPARQGQGLGALLLRAVASHAQAQEFAALWLCVWQENHAARAFYHRQGFTVAGATTIWVETTPFADWVMVKPLV